MMRQKQASRIAAHGRPLCAGGIVLLLAASCAPVQIEHAHEVKPIHIVADINLRIDREIEEFFAFQEKYEPPSTTQPATQAVVNSQTNPNNKTGGSQ